MIMITRISIEIFEKKKVYKDNHVGLVNYLSYLRCENLKSLYLFIPLYYLFIIIIYHTLYICALPFNKSLKRG